MESISIKGKRGRPRILYADTKYNMPLNKFYLDGKHVRSQMPDPPGKKKRPGRPRAFDKHASNHVRSMIERFNGWVKAFRRVAIRYDRLPPQGIAMSSLRVKFLRRICDRFHGIGRPS